MRVLQTLSKQQAENCVALTYNLDLPFFEFMLFEPLYYGGCRNVTVLCDPRQYDIALDDIPVLKHLGQRYLCLPATVAEAAFHTKIILLTSSEAGLLLIGSGNVSRSGLTHNQEVWTRFAYADSMSDEFTRLAFRWAFDYLGRLSEAERDPMLVQRLEQLWQTTAWLRKEPGNVEGHGCWLLHNLDNPLMDQLVDLWKEHDGSAVLEAIVVSPYFDVRSLAFKALLERLRPERISLITEPEAPGLNPGALQRLLDDAGTPLDTRRPRLNSRRLHAKAFALRTEQGSWVLTGSPNFSRPAMLRSAEDGNAETAVLRYEPDLAYVNTVLAPILEKAEPMALDWAASPEDTDEVSEDRRPVYRLIRAEATDLRLSCVVQPGVPEHARLRVELTGQETRSFETGRWERDGYTVRLELPEEARPLLSAPVSVRLMVESADVQKSSTRAAVNHGTALLANSRPLQRRDRIVVPGRLVSEDFEQDIDLLNRLQDLLAMNPQQLRNRRGVPKQTAEELRREDAMSVNDPEGYDPEAMIVDERLRRIEVQTGLDLYVDFYERAFYEDVLAAARAAVYRPQDEAKPSAEDPPEDGTVDGIPPTTESIQPLPLNEAAMERVSRGFARLVKNFELGMQDSEYLTQVPPTYIRELFFILTIFLRSLWRQKKIDDRDFFDLSERLFAAFLGDEQEVTGWPAISRVVATEQAKRDGSRYFVEQAWLHLYVLADYALIEDEGRLPDLARLLRLAMRELSSAEVLIDLQNDTLKTLWHSSFSRDQSAPQAEAAVHDLIEYSQWYSEETLRQGLKRSLGVRVNIERRGGWDLPAVPIMEVEGVWSDDHLNTYWRAFVEFCRWPAFKKNVRLEVRDSNILPGEGSTERLILFYRSERQRLTIVVKPNDEALACKKQTGEVSLRELSRLREFSDVLLA